MAIRLKQLVPCLVLLSIISFSHAKAKSCKCTDSGQDHVRRNKTYDAFSHSLGYYLIDKNSGALLTVGKDFLRNKSDSEANNTVVLCTILPYANLWTYLPNQQTWVDYAEASFSAIIVYQPLLNQSLSSLAFLVLPFDTMEVGYEELVGHHPLDVTNMYSTSGSANVYGRTSVSVVIGTISSDAWLRSYGHPVVVNVTVDPATVATVASKYVVWIDCDPVERLLSVYVGLEGKPKPENPIAEVRQSIKSVYSPVVNFGLLSTAAQLLRVGNHSWNVTVSDFPDFSVTDKGGSLSIILASVFGSLSAAAAVAAVVGYYFNSKYRRWHKELTQLAKSMGRLPGVPIRIDFADIKKATNNFDESKKIGGGGFGTVYRCMCKLPAGASKTEQPVDVAVKKFTRDLKNGSYDDFLNEVSIVNGLRHKNIVPIVGWAYDQGVRLLVFEFMNNGSLDQHLFPRGVRGQRRSDEAIQQWGTRYEIVKDVATGLHYVHHEYEPMVLHCDIKASNVMLDSSFRARLGDFGLSCIVAADRNSVTAVGGTRGYIAPEYAVCGKATRQTDIYALGVLILEVVTGQQALVVNQVAGGNNHITELVWGLHRDGRLPECVDASVLGVVDEEEQRDSRTDAERLLLLGLACSNPNPSDRPTMPEVMKVICKLAPPPEVPLQKLRFVWPPPEEGRSMTSDDDSAGMSIMSNLDSSVTRMGEAHVHISVGHPVAALQARAIGRNASFS